MMLRLVPPWMTPTVTTPASSGSIFARHQRLQRRHDPSGEHDRILAEMRLCAMAADAAHADIDAVDIGERIAVGPANAARRPRRIVEGNGVVGLGKAGIEPVLEHRLRAEHAFLGGLADHHDRSRPLPARRRDPPRRADPAGHVRVVPAGVHDAGFRAVRQSDDDPLRRRAGRSFRSPAGRPYRRG